MFQVPALQVPGMHVLVGRATDMLYHTQAGRQEENLRNVQNVLL